MRVVGESDYSVREEEERENELLTPVVLLRRHEALDEQHVRRERRVLQLRELSVGHVNSRLHGGVLLRNAVDVVREGAIYGWVAQHVDDRGDEVLSRASVREVPWGMREPRAAERGGSVEGGACEDECAPARARARRVSVLAHRVPALAHRVPAHDSQKN